MTEEENHFDHTLEVVECEPARLFSGSVNSASTFRISIDYFNNTQYHVNMRLRNGMIIPYEANYRGDGKFTVVVEMILGCNVVQSIYRQVCEELKSNNFGEELQVIKEAIEARIDMRSTNLIYTKEISIKLEYSINSEKLVEFGTVYLKEPDVVLSIETEIQIPYHPMSKQTEHLNVLNRLKVTDVRPGITLGILYVSKNRNAKSKFAVMLGKVVEVEPTYDKNLLDGVYLYERNLKQKDYDRAEKRYYRDADNMLVEASLGAETDMSTVSVLKDDTSKMHIFDSYSEAVESMDSESRHKAEAAKAAVELVQLKNAHEIHLLEVNKQREKDEARHKEDLYSIEQERKATESRLELNKIAYRDEYDRRSIERKDSSESIKWVPGIITGLGAVFGLFSVFSKK